MERFGFAEIRPAASTLFSHGDGARGMPRTVYFGSGLAPKSVSIFVL